MHFGEFFKRRRLEKGVSNWFIEKKTGYSRSNLSSIEKGTLPPSDEVLELLASVEELQTPLVELRAWRLRSQYSPEELRIALKLEEEE